MWLIYTPKGRVDIEAHPGVKAHLLPFKARLEARATKQAWWELQQAQAAYEPAFNGQGIAFPDISQGPKFSTSKGCYIDCTAFLIPSETTALSGLCGSKASWFHLFAIANPLRGQTWRLRLKAQYVGSLPMPVDPSQLESLSPISGDLGRFSGEAGELIAQVHHRFGDIAPAAAHLPAFRKWPSLDFVGLRALVQKRLKQDISVAERDQWDKYLTAQRAAHAALAARIADAEAELNARVDALFGLTRDESALIAETLAGQY